MNRTTVHIDLADDDTRAVVYHCPHIGYGEWSWRLGEPFMPEVTVYLTGTPAELREFGEACITAADRLTDRLGLAVEEDVA